MREICVKLREIAQKMTQFTYFAHLEEHIGLHLGVLLRLVSRVPVVPVFPVVPVVPVEPLGDSPFLDLSIFPMSPLK